MKVKYQVLPLVLVLLILLVGFAFSLYARSTFSISGSTQLHSVDQIYDQSIPLRTSVSSAMESFYYDILVTRSQETLDCCTVQASIALLVEPASEIKCFGGTMIQTATVKDVLKDTDGVLSPGDQIRIVRSDVWAIDDESLLFQDTFNLLCPGYTYLVLLLQNPANEYLSVREYNPDGLQSSNYFINTDRSTVRTVQSPAVLSDYPGVVRFFSSEKILRWNSDMEEAILTYYHVPFTPAIWQD